MVFTGQVFLTATWYARRVTWKNTHTHSHTQIEGENVGRMLGNFNDPIFLKKKEQDSKGENPTKSILYFSLIKIPDVYISHVTV